MSFIGKVEQGKAYAAGYFLAHEECERTSATLASDGGKYVRAGTIYPSNDADAIGIVYEDVAVTKGNTPGSVVLSGVVYLDRLPIAPASGAKTALEAKGFTFITTAPAVTRPNWTND